MNMPRTCFYLTLIMDMKSFMVVQDLVFGFTVWVRDPQGYDYYSCIIVRELGTNVIGLVR
jgi:hypothetical protein